MEFQRVYVIGIVVHRYTHACVCDVFFRVRPRVPMSIYGVTARSCGLERASRAHRAISKNKIGLCVGFLIEFNFNGDYCRLGQSPMMRVRRVKDDELVNIMLWKLVVSCSVIVAVYVKV